VGALVAIVVAAGGIFVVRVVQFHDAAKPGVRLLGQDVGGKSKSQLESLVRRWGAVEVTIRGGGRTYHVPRGWLVELDPAATATRALAAGSAVSLVVPRTVDVSPVVARSGGAENVLGQIAQAGRQPVSATVALHGATVATTPAQDGLELDRRALLEKLAAGATSLDAPFKAVPPPITTAPIGAPLTQPGKSTEVWPVK